MDIANSGGPDILAADSGTVITSGWSTVGYGNYVVIDHGNGDRTLYGHMQTLYVAVGQTVNRGDRIGKWAQPEDQRGPIFILKLFQEEFT